MVGGEHGEVFLMTIIDTTGREHAMTRKARSGEHASARAATSNAAQNEVRKPRLRDEIPPRQKTEIIDKQQDGTRLSGSYGQACWALMADAWAYTCLPKIRGCHRWLAPGAGAVSVQWAPGQARWGNLQNSHSIWASPVSAARLARLRSAEIRTAVDSWVDQDPGHGVEFLTLTVRHNAGQGLKSVWDVVAKAWRSVVGGASWHGGARCVGDKHEFGVAHWVRSVEITHSYENGWHVHVHALLLTTKKLKQKQRKKLRARLFERWKNACLRAGFDAPTEERGIDLKSVMNSSGSAAIGEYLAKGQTSKIAMEVASGQASKQARGKNRTPFQILGDIGRADRAGEDYGRDLQTYHEWERVSNGRRAIGWSKNAKAELGVKDLSDEELLQQDDDENFSDPYAVALVPRDSWHRPTSCSSKPLSDDVVARQSVLDAVKTAKTPEQARDRAAEVLADLGVYSLAVVAKVNPEKETREQAREKARKQASEFASMLRAVG